MKLLHLDSSVLGERSISRQLTAAIVEKLRDADREIKVIHRDLVATPPPHMTIETLPGDHPTSALAGRLDPAAQRVRDESQRILEEFIAVDALVIGAPIYNFTIPSQLKSWIDVIIVPGRTFSYAEASPQDLAGGRPKGLAAGKRVIIALTRGDFRGPQAVSASASAEHAESYLRTVFSFVGIDDLEFVRAEGLAHGDGNRARGIASALESVRQLAA